MIMKRVYHEWNSRLVEIAIFGGCKNHNWANGDIGIFVNGTIGKDPSADCWGSQTKLSTENLPMVLLQIPIHQHKIFHYLLKDPN